MISQETSRKIYNAHQQIKDGEKLIATLKESVDKYGDLLIADAFGRRKGLELHVPNSESSWSVYGVPPELCFKIIDAHIEGQRKLLAELNAIAAVEAA